MKKGQKLSAVVLCLMAAGYVQSVQAEYLTEGDTRARYSNAIGSDSIADQEKTVSVGSKGNERRITNVLEGVKSTDAANVWQVRHAKIEAVEYTDFRINENNREIKTVIETNKEITVERSKKQTEEKIEKSEQNTNKNISDAKKDAITSGKQYTQAIISETKAEINNTVNNAKQEAVSVSNQYTNYRIDQVQANNNTRFDSMEKRIDKNAEQANAGIASVAAMTNIPYTLDTDFSAGIGIGNYHNGNALAAGAQYQVRRDVNLRGSVSLNDSDSAVVGAGLAIGW